MLHGSSNQIFQCLLNYILNIKKSCLKTQQSVKIVADEMERHIVELNRQKFFESPIKPLALNEINDLLLMVINSKNVSLLKAYFELLSGMASYGLLNESNLAEVIEQFFNVYHSLEGGGGTLLKDDKINNTLKNSSSTNEGVQKPASLASIYSTNNEFIDGVCSPMKMLQIVFCLASTCKMNGTLLARYISFIFILSTIDNKNIKSTSSALLIQLTSTLIKSSKNMNYSENDEDPTTLQNKMNNDDTTNYMIDLGLMLVNQPTKWLVDIPSNFASFEICFIAIEQVANELCESASTNEHFHSVLKANIITVLLHRLNTHFAKIDSFSSSSNDPSASRPAREADPNPSNKNTNSINMKFNNELDCADHNKCKIIVSIAKEIYILASIFKFTYQLDKDMVEEYLKYLLKIIKYAPDCVNNCALQSLVRLIGNSMLVSQHFETIKAICIEVASSCYCALANEFSNVNDCSSIVDQHNLNNVASVVVGDDSNVNLSSPFYKNRHKSSIVWNALDAYLMNNTKAELLDKHAFVDITTLPSYVETYYSNLGVLISLKTLFMIDLLKVLRKMILTMDSEDQPDVSIVLKSIHTSLQLLFNQCDDSHTDVLDILIENLSVCVSVSLDLANENYIFQRLFITSLCDSAIVKTDDTNRNEPTKQHIATMAIFDLLAQHPILINSATSVIIDSVKIKIFQYDWPISYVLSDVVCGLETSSKWSLYPFISPFDEAPKSLLTKYSSKLTKNVSIKNKAAFQSYKNILVSLTRLSDEKFQETICKMMNYIFGKYIRAKSSLRSKNLEIVQFAVGFSFDVLFTNLSRLELVFEYTDHFLQLSLYGDVMQSFGALCLGYLYASYIDYCLMPTSNTSVCSSAHHTNRSICLRNALVFLCEKTAAHLTANISSQSNDVDENLLKYILILLTYTVDRCMSMWDTHLFHLLITIFNQITLTYSFPIYPKNNKFFRLLNIEAVKEPSQVILQQIYSVIHKIVNHHLSIMFPQEQLLKEVFDEPANQYTGSCNKESNTRQLFELFLQMLSHFVIVCPDLNKSLSAVGFVLNLCDYMRVSIFQNTETSPTLSTIKNVYSLWYCIFESLCQMCFDYRGAIRKCAVHTILSVFQVHNSIISTECYIQLTTKYIFPSLSMMLYFYDHYIVNIELGELYNKSNVEFLLYNLLVTFKKDNELIVHHTRNTFEKQWLETFVSFSSEITAEICQNPKSYVASDILLSCSSIAPIIVDTSPILIHCYLYLMSESFKQLYCEINVDLLKNFCSILNKCVSYSNCLNIRKNNCSVDSYDFQDMPPIYDDSVVDEITLNAFKLAVKSINTNNYNDENENDAAFDVGVKNFCVITTDSNYWLFCWELWNSLVFDYIFLQVMQETYENIPLCVVSVCSNTLGKIIDYLPPKIVASNRATIFAFIVFLYDFKPIQFSARRFDSTFSSYYKKPIDLYTTHVNVYFILKQLCNHCVRWRDQNPVELLQIIQTIEQCILFMLGRIIICKQWFTEVTNGKDLALESQTQLSLPNDKKALCLNDILQLIILNSSSFDQPNAHQSQKFMQSRLCLIHLTILLFTSFVCSLEETNIDFKSFDTYVNLLSLIILNHQNSASKELSFVAIRSVFITIEHLSPVIARNIEAYSGTLKGLIDILSKYLFKPPTKTTLKYTKDSDKLLMDTEVVQFLSNSLIDLIPNIDDGILSNIVNTLLLGFQQLDTEPTSRDKPNYFKDSLKIEKNREISLDINDICFDALVKLTFKLFNRNTYSSNNELAHAVLERLISCCCDCLEDLKSLSEISTPSSRSSGSQPLNPTSRPAIITFKNAATSLKGSKLIINNIKNIMAQYPELRIEMREFLRAQCGVLYDAVTQTILIDFNSLRILLYEVLREFSEIIKDNSL